MKKRSRKKVMGTQTSFEDDLAYHEQCPLTTLLKCLPQFGGMVELYFGCKLCEFGSLYQGEQTFLQHVNSCHAQHSQPPDPLQRCDKVLEPGWDSLPDVCQAEGSIQTSLTAATSTSVVEKARQLSQAPNEDSQLYENTIGEIILEEQEVSFEGQVELGIDIKHEMSATDCEELRESEPMPNEAAGAKMADQQVEQGESFPIPSRRLSRKAKCCNFCRRRFASEKNLTKHISEHHAQKLKSQHICLVCNAEFLRREELAAHRKLHEMHENGFRCADCGKLFRRYERLQDHTNIHTGRKPHGCNKCDKRFALSNVASRHRLTCGRGSKYPCDLCGKEYTQPERLRRHVLMHSVNKELSIGDGDAQIKHRCLVCGEVFLDRSELVTHRKLHETADNGFKCPDCSKTFKSYYVFKDHCNIHSGLKLYSCRKCNASFHIRDQYRRHMRKCEGGVRFTCDPCGKNYDRAESLRRHQQLHHSTNEPLKCHLCGKLLLSRETLRNHITTHTREGWLPCRICDKTFRDKYKLRDHILKVHDGVKPYKCSYCGRAFAWKEVLQTHERVHTGEKPYTCSKCGSSFRNRASYNTHVKKRCPILDSNHKK